jgi:hypothetical protein
MDKPVTDAELDQFYGREVTQAEIEDAIARQAAAFDAYDLAEIVSENSEVFLNALKEGRLDIVSSVMNLLRKGRIASRASIELYGKTNMIQPSEVKL